MLSVLVLSVVLVAPVAGDARGEQSQLFPSETLWTIALSESPVGTPAADGNGIYIPLQSAIAALSLRDHTELWRAKLVAEGPIVVAADRVLVPAGGAVVALDAKTGSEIWRAPVERPTAPIVAHGDVALVAAAETLAAYRLADGTAAWQTKPIGTIEQRAAVSENWVYVPIADGSIVALDVTTGAQIWERRTGIKPAEPLVAGDRLFVGSEGKQFCSYRVSNGTQLWCFPVGAPIVGAPAADARRVYFVALDNQIWALDRRNGGRLWKNDLGYRPSAGPTIVGETVTAPGKTDKLIAFDVATGKPAGPQLAMSRDLVAPAVFVPTSDGTPVRVVVLFGDLTSQWNLMVAQSPPPALPSIKVEGLTTLPGRVVPLAAARAPRG